MHEFSDCLMYSIIFIYYYSFLLMFQLCYCIFFLFLYHKVGIPVAEFPINEAAAYKNNSNNNNSVKFCTKDFSYLLARTCTAGAPPPLSLSTPLCVADVASL